MQGHTQSNKMAVREMERVRGEHVWQVIVCTECNEDSVQVFVCVCVCVCTYPMMRREGFERHASVAWLSQAWRRTESLP